MADESQAINRARNYATDNKRYVAIAIDPDGEVVVRVGEDKPDTVDTIGEAAGRDALETLNRAIDAADSFVHARDNAKVKPAEPPRFGVIDGVISTDNDTGGFDDPGFTAPNVQPTFDSGEGAE